MTPIPALDYALLWGERSLRSVANVTRADATEFLALAASAGIRVRAESHPLEDANDVLARLKAGHVQGAAVLVP
jgi:propanol-preferring alcohol dehydrogenase